VLGRVDASPYLVGEKKKKKNYKILRGHSMSL
jgi:hypothetical protein